MRRLCLIVGMSAILALPVGAQQTKDGANDGTKTSGENGTSSNVSTTTNTTGDATTNAPAASTTAPAPRNLFAMPAPRPTPFPAPSSSADEGGPAKLTPKFELGAMYSYVNFHPASPFNSFGSNGGTASFVYNANRWLGLVAEAGAYGFTRNDIGFKQDGGFQTYLFGPRLNLRKFNYFVPFAEFLIGGFRGDGQVTGGGPQSSFALATGGGVDIVFTKNIAWRFAQIDYLMTNDSGPFLGVSSRQNNLRLGTGLVLRWGFPPPPPPAPKGPPVAACSASPTSVFAGSNDPVAVHVNASSPESLPLTYSYTATGGAVEGTGPDARWNSTGTAVGTYTVNAKVDDGKGGTASCSADISVQEKPHHPPTISCAANPSTIQPGEKSTITSTASSPDNLDLTYSYSAAAGQVSGTGPTAQFDSTGLQAGSYKVNCSVTDSRGDKADNSANVDVQQPPPPPQATKVGECGYTKAGVARFDNLCKRVGDDVALRLKNDPNAKVVIVGYADPKEPKAAKLAQSRADLAKAYLGEKGIDASRSTTRTGQASAEKGAEKENRRVEFIFVPDGATY
jgi:outer membrane protein OmpA-like peptidoglycan-associated protein